jgi:hypothetical protein
MNLKDSQKDCWIGRNNDGERNTKPEKGSKKKKRKRDAVRNTDLQEKEE